MTALSTPINFIKNLTGGKAFLLSRGLLLLLMFLTACDGYDPVERPPTTGNVSTSPKLKVVNSGEPGNNTFDLIRRLSTGVTAYKPNLVIIMIGTNDIFTVSKLVSTAHYEENINQIVAAIKQQGSEVLLMSPPPVGTQNSGDPALYNARIDTLKIVLTSAAAKNNCLYFDMNKAFKDQGTPNDSGSSLLINYANSNYNDGIHPTKSGYLFMGQALYHLLKANGVEYNTIVCFGDSITYGSGMAGQGTVTGDTYPAVLFRSLSN